MLDKDVEIEKIVVEYKNGEKEIITKGGCFGIPKVDKDGKIELNIYCCNMSGKEMATVLYGVTEMAMELESSKKDK